MRGKMRATAFSILLVVCTSNFGFAGDIILPRLPDLYAFRYTPAPRDPFISADAGKTLVGKGVELDNSFSSKAAQRYLQTLVAAIQNDLFVEGVSTGEGQSHAIALINGVAFSETEKIPVTVSETDLVQLTELARTYGLPLERDMSEKNTILLEVGSIDSGGVSILLPGFRAPLCKLPYVGDSGTERITLERKKKAEHD
jgi:hypothetical protein